MEANANALNWFEIPVTDMDRAQKFYEGIFDTKMILNTDMGMPLVLFPIDMNSGKVGGALVKNDDHQPGETGVLIYLNANPDIQGVIDRVEEFGGKVTIPRTDIGQEMGFMACFTDTEGNRLGLHADN